MFKQFFRRQVVVNSKLQYGVVSFFVCLSCINIIFFLFAYWLSQKQIVDGLMGLDGPEQLYALDLLQKQGAAFFRASAMFSLFSVSLSIVLGLVLLNHIAGPAYVVEQYIETWLRGEAPKRHPLKFRKHDFFYTLAEKISALYDKIHEGKNNPKSQ
ncbi:MAG: hypothetical protein JNM39_13470 [Bdellovibrionaceae bacterium]|nr:hypothetical protein [Pseudobdellovibrionaceae bacterium]